MIGNYGEARMLVRRTPSGIVTGLRDARGVYVNDMPVPTFNGTEGGEVVLVLAHATPISYIEMIAPYDSVVPGYDIK